MGVVGTHPLRVFNNADAVRLRMQRVREKVSEGVRRAILGPFRRGVRPACQKTTGKAMQLQAAQTKIKGPV